MMRLGRLLMIIGIISLIPTMIVAFPIPVPGINALAGHVVPFVWIWKIGAPFGIAGIGLVILPRVGRLFGFSQPSEQG